MPVGYRPVHVKWKDLDKCNVCHMDEVKFFTFMLSLPNHQYALI